MPNVSAHFGDRLNESPELIAQEWAVKSTPTPTTSCLNESPELIAQESRQTSLCRPGRPCSLNESPELIAQECHELDPCRAGPDASMKVLSLLLRNSTIPLAVASLAGPQ